jgi:hypothetical protein
MDCKGGEGAPSAAARQASIRRIAPSESCSEALPAEPGADPSGCSTTPSQTAVSIWPEPLVRTHAVAILGPVLAGIG